VGIGYIHIPGSKPPIVGLQTLVGNLIKSAPFIDFFVK
jgi:hypothetical protein